MGELVTLQFGRAANWVGAHLWNLNNDPAARSPVLFSGRQRPTPRLVAFDLFTSVGSAHTDAPSGGDINEGVPANVVRIERQTCELDPLNPRLWTDFLSAPLQRDSVVRLGNLDWNDSNPNEFHSFVFGRRLMASENNRDNFTDPLRKQVEDCDELQGFPVLCDFTQPAFAGFTADYVQHLQDEFPKAPILLFAIGVDPELPPLANPLQRERRLLNESLAVQSLHSADIFVPLPLAPSPALFELPLYQASNRLHSSGLLAIGLEAALSPLWLSRSPRPVAPLLSHLSRAAPSRRLAALSLALPYSPASDRRPALLCPMLSAAGSFPVDSAVCVTRGAAALPTDAIHLRLALPPLAKSDILQRLCYAPPVGLEPGAAPPPFVPPPALAQIEKTGAFHARLAALASEFARVDRNRVVQSLSGELTADEVREAQAALAALAESYASE